jgi:hypothetical protein
MSLNEVIDDADDDELEVEPSVVSLQDEIADLPSGFELASVCVPFTWFRVVSASFGWIGLVCSIVALRFARFGCFLSCMCLCVCLVYVLLFLFSFSVWFC